MNKKHSKEDILEKGQAIIRQKGYNNTGVNDILRACAIPKGSFYNFFSSKEEFGIQLLDYYGQKNLVWIDEILSNPNESPLTRLKTLYMRLATAPDRDPNFGGCLVYNMANEMGPISDSIAAAANRNFQLWVDRVTICVAQAQAVKEISNQLDAAELAEFMHTSISGTMARAKSLRDKAPLLLMYNFIFDYIDSKK